MGDKSLPAPVCEPVIPEEKPYVKPADVPATSPEDGTSLLSDFARAITWTQQAFKLQESVIETEKSVIIYYPQGQGSATNDFRPYRQTIFTRQ